jgi:hypothetical protein
MKTNEEGMIVMTKAEYDNMMDRLDWLECLEAAGVDNWEGIDCAIDMRHENGED